MSGGGDLRRKTAQGCTHSDLQWPETPTPKRNGSGWLYHCTCRQCGATVFRAAREPGADRYGLQPDVRAQIEEAWREFTEGRGRALAARPGGTGAAAHPGAPATRDPPAVRYGAARRERLHTVGYG